MKPTSAEFICAASELSAVYRQRWCQPTTTRKELVMGKTATMEGTDMMPLTKALKVLKQKYPWMPASALRQAVVDGKVPSIRSSDKKGAYYYVRLEDLVNALPSNTQEA
jgi:hypothetical protein